MVITNTKNLPQQVVDAIDTTPHNKDGEISATTLLKGVREFLLEKRHGNEIEVDASKLVWALFGTAFHSLMEKETPDTFVEEKFSQRVGLYKVTGKLDGYDMKHKVIYDYKTTSVYTYLNKDFDKYRKQGLIYTWLLNKEGLKVAECQFILFFKDWRKSEAKTKANYPDSQVYTYSFVPTEEDLNEIEQFIYSKVAEVQEAEKLSDEDLPLCSEGDRWKKADTFKVMKKGRKTSLKNFTSEEDAKAMASELGEDHYVEFVEGTDGKCNGYCNACKFCSYWKEKYEGVENE